MNRMQSIPQLLTRIERGNLWLAAVAVAVAGLVWGPQGMVAAAVGAVLACLNFFAIRRLAGRAIERLAAGARGREAARLSALLVGKMALLFASVWAAVRVAGLAVLPFSLGISVFVASILISGLAGGLASDEEAG